MDRGRQFIIRLFTRIDLRQNFTYHHRWMAKKKTNIPRQLHSEEEYKIAVRNLIEEELLTYGQELATMLGADCCGWCPPVPFFD